MKVKEAGQMVSSKVSEVKTYWKKPPKGRYMSFKEIVSLAVGGMGIKFVIFCVQYMILNVGNTLIGNTIGIPPKELYFIYILSVIISLPLMTLRAQIIDTARHKKGKYRPYVLIMGLPTAILAVAFVFMPYENMTTFWKCFTVLAFNVGFHFFYQFYYDVDQSIINVLSPNTIERSDVYSIKSVVDSFAPTIGNIIIPLLARAVTGENTLVDIRIYRVVYPPIIIGGFLLGLLIYFNTEEKIIQAKTHTIKVKFSDAFKAVVHNKYFWIISLAGWIGFLEVAVQNIMDWLYSYQDACTAVEYSIITAIRGNASLWPMLFVPFLIRAIGKRKLLVVSNIINIIFIIIMLPIIRIGDLSHIIWWLLVCFFFNYMGSTVGLILTPSLNGDIRDYQHYITGERIDGMFVAVGAIGSVITLITNSVLPSIYDKAGLNEKVAISLGYDGTNVYDVLHNEMYFRDICGVLIIAATVGATLNVIPFFFYDLTEVKQKAMVTVLKIRALFEDYGNNALSDEALVEAIDIIEEANEYAEMNEIAIDKKLPRKERKKIKETNEKIYVAKFVYNEVNKFSTPEMIAQVEEAKALIERGLQGLINSSFDIKKAKSLPKKTQEEKEFRHKEINKNIAIRDSKKAIKKYYSDGVIEEFDFSVFDKLFSAEDENEKKIDELYKKYNSIKDSAEKKIIKSEIESCKVIKKQIKNEIKKATDQSSIFARAAKPYLDAKKLLAQRDNYLHYEDIKAKYEESKAKIAQA